MYKTLLVLVTMSLMTACTWVKLSPDGKNVAVLTAMDVQECRLTGETTVNVRDKVGLQRSADKVRLELETLARNAAAERGGDVVVPTSGVKPGGERDYNIYRCRP